MKIEILLNLALVLSNGSFAGSTALKTAPQATPVEKTMNSFRGHGLVEGGGGVDDINSHIFGIEGEVVRIRETGNVLDSITIKLTRPLPTALGWIPYEKPDETIVVHFGESLSELGSLQLTPGSIVRLAFGAIDNKSGQPQDWGSNWGSNFSWLTVEKNGAFYNTKGEKVE